MIADGKDMRALRLKKRFSLTYVAGKMGVAISYLCDLEHNRKEWNFKLEQSFIKATNEI